MAEPETIIVAVGLPSERNALPTVFVPMAADLVHAGHVNILNVSHQYGRVIVGLMTDEGMQSYKRAPILPFEQRQAVVQSFFQVDEVIQLHGKDFSEPLLRIKPDFMVHGSDWSDPLSPQFLSRTQAIQLMASWGGQVIEPEYTRGISTTDIIKCCAHRHCVAERTRENRFANGSKPSKVVPCLSGCFRCLRLMLGVAPAVLPHQRNLSLCLYLASRVLGVPTGITAQQQNQRRDIICDQTVGLVSGVAFALGLCLPPTAPPTLAVPCCAVLSVEAASSMLALSTGAVEETVKSGSSEGCWTAFDTVCSVAQHLFLSSLWCWTTDACNEWLGCMAGMAPLATLKFLKKCAEVNKLLHA